MPLTDQEMELERRMEDLRRIGYNVNVDLLVGIRVGVDPRGHGARWAAQLSRHGQSYPEGFGDTGVEALEDAVNQARKKGAL